MIRVTCKNCEHIFKVIDSGAGEPAKCEKCKTVTIAPGQSHRQKIAAQKIKERKLKRQQQQATLADPSYHGELLERISKTLGSIYAMVFVSFIIWIALAVLGCIASVSDRY